MLWKSLVIVGYVALASQSTWAAPHASGQVSLALGAAAVALVCHWIRWSLTTRAEEARG